MKLARIRFWLIIGSVGLVLFFFALRWSIDRLVSPSSPRVIPAITGASDCGPRSLGVVCGLLGIPASMDELAFLAGTDNTGTTINGLCQAAAQKGINAQIAKLSVAELRELTHPAILFVDGNHFIVVDLSDNEQLRIWDGPKPPLTVQDEYLMQHWEGHTIVLEPTTATTGPRLVIEKAMYYFGSISENQRISHIFRVRNLGNADLRILRVQSSCRCTVAAIEKEIILPGESGDIKIDFSGRGSFGSVMEQVRLTTNDIIYSSRVLTVAGEVRPIPKALPQIISVRATSGTTQTALIAIHASQNQIVRILWVDSNVPEITSVVRKTGNQATVALQIPVDALYDISDPKVVLHTDCNDAPNIEVPIRVWEGVVIPCSPKRLFFGIIKSGEQPVREVHFPISDPSGFVAHKIDSPSFLSTELISGKPDTFPMLKVTLSRSADKGSLQGTIILHVSYCGEQETISIPVYAIVTD